MSEFNEFKPRLKSARTRFSIERRLKSWNIEYNFKWNQPYLSRRLNLSRGSNYLDLASGEKKARKVNVKSVKSEAEFREFEPRRKF